MGLVRALRRLHNRANPTLTILAYHRVMPIDALEAYPFDRELISATPAQFDWQMRYVREHLHPVSLHDIIAHLDDGIPLPPLAIAITFDDGFSDTYRYAFPILKRYGIPATIFVSTGYVDTQRPFWFELAAYLVHRVSPLTLQFPDGRAFPDGDSHEDRTLSLRQVHDILKDLPNNQRTALIDKWSVEFNAFIAHDALHHSLPISWDQIRTMSKSGITFGSHTVTHPNLTRLSGIELDHELGESKRTLETHLQQPIDTLAYPIGTRSAFDDRVISATRRHGFKLGVTYISGANLTSRIERFQLRRHGVGLKMTPWYFRALTTLPAWLD